jgi:iron-sulfur cluster assembly accessory protein
VSLTKRGCNGLSYNMNYISKPDRFDEVVEEEGLKLVIDSKALLALVGTELDYVVTDTSEEFVFKNPNEKGKCGCGESFHV